MAGKSEDPHLPGKTQGHLKIVSTPDQSISSTTNSAKFHERGAASLENLFAGLIRGSNDQRLAI
jgi:hypothetical protein